MKTARGRTEELPALSFADVLERLFRKFEDQVSLTAIAGLVRESRRQLQGSPPQAIPELSNAWPASA